MVLITFFVSFLLFLLASSILITAFFCVTRGYSETLPDGTERRYGKILKGYYFFWFKEKVKQKLYYKDDELAIIADQISAYYDADIYRNGDPFKKGSSDTLICDEAFIDYIPLLRKKLEIGFQVEDRASGKLFLKVYQEEAVYVFPEWIRTVMAGCITCTPTVYGNIVFWSAYFLLKRDVTDSFLLPFKDSGVSIFFVWIAYWISLSWLNTVLWNIYYNKQ